MKKFRLLGNSIIRLDGEASPQAVVRANSYADIIDYIESNADWHTTDYHALKVPISRRLWNEDDLQDTNCSNSHSYWLWIISSNLSSLWVQQDNELLVIYLVSEQIKKLELTRFELIS
ncbi:hypothetical protein OGZ37_11090 [Lactococcus lactis]|uniref:hypothetical protein n=1 Tax=Lactococcus lactis TaxID=1358 RepID=UPI002418479C|nr:hypothetical protein [Lactococcus lactis]MDG4967108.1 hypothetical protein [Lactococcus lactis]